MMTDEREYASHYLDCVFPQFAKLIKENGGDLPEENYPALRNYAVGAVGNFGMTPAEVDGFADRHGIPRSILDKARNLNAND